MDMIRWSRIDIPALPRPVYEVQAHEFHGELCVTLMAGGEFACQANQFPPSALLPGGHLERWLLSRPWVSMTPDVWSELGAILARRLRTSLGLEGDDDVG
jgi:hypothetical protein